MSNKCISYVVAAACFMIQAVGIGTFVTYGVFFNSLASDLGWSRATISGASSLAFILSGVFAMLIGRLNDIFGPRNLMCIASIFLGSGAMLMSQVREIWQLYVFYGIIFGIGLSAIDVIALTTTARWFSHSRGLMTGLVKVGTGAGQFLIPFVASILIVNYGWRQAYLIIGFAVLVILFSVGLVLKRDPASENVSGISAIHHQPKSPTRHAGNLNVKEAFNTFQLWIICGVSVLVVFCLLTILVHIVPHARDQGLSAPQAAGVLSTIGAISMLGRFTAGVAIDRKGSKPVMVGCFLILLTALLWLQVADSLWMLYLFACVYGLAHGAFFTAISPITAEVFGIASHGAIFGIVVFFGTAGGAMGPIVAGYLFDMTLSYVITFKILALINMVSLALISFLKPIDPAILKQ